ncbi:transposase [Sorangium cellulosum]|uniref:transposase n=1 Tax=Sorangium cellulosum TaxID=56 RepID=UPI003B848F9D
MIRAGGQVFSKPWGQRARSPDLFSKRDFKIDLRAKTITCPAGQVEVFEPGDTVEFDPEECGACPLRAKCTQAASGRGRTVSIAEDEALQGKFRKLQQTGPGRAVLRQRTAVEQWSMRLPTSRRAKDTARATSAPGETCSTSGVPQRSRISSCPRGVVACELPPVSCASAPQFLCIRSSIP